MTVLRNFLISMSITVVFMALYCGGNPEAEVKNLPGLNYKPNFKQYSGFLKAGERYYIHYWFFEAMSNAAVSPLVVWLNGGPGTSSLAALFDGVGPFLINDDGLTLRANPNTWNTDANMLFIESPAGVGYSYSTDFNVTSDDDETSLTNYNTLKEFYAQFPQYRRSDLYITGVSYAGVYAPTFVSRILDGMDDFHINLKGMAIMNGLLHHQMQTDTSVNFAYSRGMLDERLWERMVSTCCQSNCSTNCEFSKAQIPFCQFNVQKIVTFNWRGGLTPYDIYQDCYLDWKEPSNSKRMRRQAQSILSAESEPQQNQYGGTNEPCMDTSKNHKYLNQESVRQALHIPASVHAWAQDPVAVTSTYRLLYPDMTEFVLRATKSGVRVLLFFGDTDTVCNHMMGARFVASLGLPLKHAKRAWHFEQQIAGYVTEFAQGLQLLTVKGSGHMVPEAKPAVAKQLIDRFLTNQRY